MMTIVGGFYAGYFVIFVFLQAALLNLVYNHVDIGGRRLRSTLKGHRLLAIYALNTLAVLASAGLLIPWAKIRLARYRAESLSLLRPTRPRRPGRRTRRRDRRTRPK